MNTPGPEELDENDTDTSISDRTQGIDGDIPKSNGGKLVLLLQKGGLKDVLQLGLN